MRRPGERSGALTLRAMPTTEAIAPHVVDRGIGAEVVSCARRLRDLLPARASIVALAGTHVVRVTVDGVLVDVDVAQRSWLHNGVIVHENVKGCDWPMQLAERVAADLATPGRGLT